MIRDFLRDGDRLVSALLIERNQWILLSLFMQSIRLIFPLYFLSFFPADKYVQDLVRLM